MAAYQFGPYRLETAARRLTRGDETIALTPKAFDVLVALVERRDRVVDKDELMRVVWPDSFVEEANLTQTIFVLRKTLGVDAAGRQFIDTVPRRGYRFAGTVSDDEVRREAPMPSGTPRRAALAAAVVIIIVAGAGAWWARPTTPIVRSIVVLPLQNVTGNPELEYLVDGVTDALITSLGQLRELRVISRTSANSYRATSKPLPQIARELNVDAVVEGSLQRLNGHLRLNLKVIDAAADRALWAQSFDRAMDGFADLHREAVLSIAAGLSIPLDQSERARLEGQPPTDPQAFEATLKGRYLWSRRSRPDVQQAIEYFADALDRDPQYAPAHAGLADAYTIVASRGWGAPDDAWARAIASAERAIALDNQLAEGHTSRAVIAMNYEMNWAGAERGFRRAIELNPSYANAHHWLAYDLMLTGRAADADAEFRRALTLDPLSPIINANIGFGLYVARQYDAALEHWARVLELHPDNQLLHAYIGSAYAQKGMWKEAVAERQRALDLPGGGPAEVAVLAHIYARMGKTAAARAMLDELHAAANTGSVPAYYIALVYTGLGDRDRAFEWLDKSLQERSGPFNEVNADPMFDSLRSDARFDAVVRRLGLAPIQASSNAGDGLAVKWR